MKYRLIVIFFASCLTHLFSQVEPLEFETYHTAYEREILANKDATHLELLMAIGTEASRERTAAVKQDLDAFIYEIKFSDLMRQPEVKLMRELHKKVHDRFLTHYQKVVPFPRIFESGYYNCVSATALFALVLEGLEIPYNIQEQPTHVYIMAYPDTKAISVEMTALKDAYYLPDRRDISKSIKTLLEMRMITEEDIVNKGELQVYHSFYNTNSVIDLSQLAGIQYFNEAITAADENHFEEALSTICKAEKLYNVEKTRVFKMELLVTLMASAKFDHIRDIAYLMGYANQEKADRQKVYYQYVSFIHEQLVTKGNKELVDSSHAYVARTFTDTSWLAQLNSVYYWGQSEFFANSHDLGKRLEYAEKAYSCYAGNPSLNRWLARSIITQIIDKYKDEDLPVKMDEYANRYPFLQTNDLFLEGYFMIYASESNRYYADNDGEKGKKYFDLALKMRENMADKELLATDQVGWLYAEAGAYLYRKNDYPAALKLLEEGLLLAPDHQRLLARIEIVKSKMKK